MKTHHHHEPWEYMEIEDLLPTPKFEKIQNLARIELDKYKKREQTHVGVNMLDGLMKTYYQKIIKCLICYQEDNLLVLLKNYYIGR